MSRYAGPVATSVGSPQQPLNRDDIKTAADQMLTTHGPAGLVGHPPQGIAEAGAHQIDVNAECVETTCEVQRLGNRPQNWALTTLALQKERVMNKWIGAAVIGIWAVTGLGSAHFVLAKEATKAEKQAAIRKEAQTTLAKLYQIHPGAKSAIQKSAGYAEFDSFGMNLFVLSTAHGKGIAVANQGKKETFMKMISVGTGLGIGAKDFRLVFVFEKAADLNNFINSGWDADAHAEAIAKSSQKGGAYEGAISVSPGVWVYQLTEKGLALEATLQGTKYYKEDSLN